MRNLNAAAAARKADAPYEQFVAWLRRDLKTHPEYRSVFARFREEVLARAREHQRTHPETSPSESLRAALLSRVQEAVQAPLRGALAGLLRDEAVALERFVA